MGIYLKNFDMPTDEPLELHLLIYPDGMTFDVNECIRTNTISKAEATETPVLTVIQALDAYQARAYQEMQHYAENGDKEMYDISLAFCDACSKAKQYINSVTVGSETWEP